MNTPTWTRVSRWRLGFWQVFFVLLLALLAYVTFAMLLASMSTRAQAIRERFPHEFAAFREAHLSRLLLGKHR